MWCRSAFYPLGHATRPGTEEISHESSCFGLIRETWIDIRVARPIIVTAPTISQPSLILSKSILFKVCYPCIFLAVTLYLRSFRPAIVAIIGDVLVDLAE